MDISEFKRLHNKEQYSRHPWEVSRKKVLQKLLRQSDIKFPVERIVDIGAGDTYVLHTLVAAGLAKEYVAIDTAFTDEVIVQLQQNAGGSPVQYVNNLQEYYKKFDERPTLFLCMDVLEHLEHESIILDYLKGGTGNYYFFTVPAFQSVFSSHDVLLGHYRRYTLSQFTNVLSTNGFKIQNKGYYFTSLLIARYLEKFLKSDKKESIDNWEGGKFKTAVITSVLMADYTAGALLKKLGITMAGLSCYCLCKK